MSIQKVTQNIQITIYNKYLNKKQIIINEKYNSFNSKKKLTSLYFGLSIGCNNQLYNDWLNALIIIFNVSSQLK